MAQAVVASPTTATYITQTHDGTLSAEQASGDLATGILKNTTSTGVLSIATPGTDYVAPARAISTTSPLAGGGDLSANRTLTCATCVVASSPGAGVAHFAGGTQTVTSSAVAVADVAAVLKTRQETFVIGSDGGPVLVDSDDQAGVLWNLLGQGYHITKVGCQSDAGSPQSICSATMARPQTSSARI